MNGFTCCNGTALESNTKLQDSIYFHSADNQALYVNLFVPSTLTWSERKVTVQQVTDFPYADTTKLVIKGSGPVRHEGARAALGDARLLREDQRPRRGGEGDAGQLRDAGADLARQRHDRAADAVHVPSRSPSMDQPNVASIFYGPVLLAAEESGAAHRLAPGRRSTRRDIGKSITGDPATLRFKVGDASFKPFYETYGRHSVYLHVTRK